MNVHEYQAKMLFEQFEIPIPRGKVAKNEAEVTAALEAFSNDEKIVVKAQIHAGGRGKGVFSDGYKGGVQICANKADAKAAALRMLGNTLITHQTGPEGKCVHAVYFNECSRIQKEYYLAILLDRERSVPVILASTEGGMDIEKVAATTPEKIIRTHVDPLTGLCGHQSRSLAFALGLEGTAIKSFCQLLSGLYRLYVEKDASLVEINPLILTPEGTVQALDAKINFDDNALFRQPEVAAMRDLNEEDPKETEASRYNLNYIALDGNIACMVNGAGLAMSTMDIIKYYGGNPANFLDVGGGANEEQVTAAFKIIQSDPRVQGILVNIFGGIMRCDVIAKGILNAVQVTGLKLPLVVRLEGTNVKEGKQLLEQSGLKLTSANNLADAAEKIVKLVKEN
ncbi:MAG: succinate--CoA ligase subunit beta [Verrucomicrobia bacterium GWF2_51_19]|nr:MAG: succinate--CoA ligase subunit beta [Verrucomicrobia bacterium GWF2_51_19]HCJ12355.1 ADP-forming succinate--CoA ligase subunit beta [Opitutae bacterium]